jgi:hypothetical protein
MQWMYLVGVVCSSAFKLNVECDLVTICIHTLKKKDEDENKTNKIYDIAYKYMYIFEVYGANLWSTVAFCSRPSSG